MHPTLDDQAPGPDHQLVIREQFYHPGIAPPFESGRYCSS
jgi:hypothetical protein